MSRVHLLETYSTLQVVRAWFGFDLRECMGSSYPPWYFYYCLHLENEKLEEEMYLV